MMFKKLILTSFCGAICALALGCGGASNAPDPAKQAEGDAVIEAARKASEERKGK